MSIQQNQALFSILGTTYGGNGVQTFALPDLRGRVALHTGQGPGLSNYVLGEVSGTQSTTLLPGNLPSHNHLMNANTGAGNSGAPSGNLLAQGPVIGGVNVNEYTTSANTTMNATSIAVAGGSQPVSILQPYLALNYSVALQGIFPSRN
ncbi:Microcystin-dependent protein [Mucilaginibacter xinganensis]|uniref:Microcystin-dependent protein n=2 Tax=Mucilaginibacter xinganensis TaxID=1234841 RepID=A0A223NWN0_9SPHI|nr:Microcystin-dependent protein [Mucilaginibacter xinganensis]